MKNLWGRIRWVGSILHDVTRYPPNDRWSKWSLAMWAVATFTAMAGLSLQILLQNWGSFFLWLNAAALTADIIMFRFALQGVRYRQQVKRGTTRRRALPAEWPGKGSPKA